MPKRFRNTFSTQYFTCNNLHSRQHWPTEYRLIKQFLIIRQIVSNEAVVWLSCRSIHVITTVLGAGLYFVKESTDTKNGKTFING